jgi:uncharacterized membrane protein
VRMISTAIEGMGCRRLRGLRRAWLLPVGFALLSACTAKDAEQTSEPVIASDSVENSDATAFAYECEPAFAFVAQVTDKQAELFLPDRTLTLQRAPASMLAIYGGEGGTAFSMFGESARLEIAPDRSYSCANHPGRAVWEEARLRDVDFRATGNEPGWYLEITDGKTILFVTDYGERRYEFPAPEPRVHQEVALTVFQAGNDAHALSVTLRGEGCQDTMSGATFDTRVSVRLDEKDYMGCGKTLH